MRVILFLVEEVVFINWGILFATKVVGYVELFGLEFITFILKLIFIFRFGCFYQFYEFFKEFFI